MLDELRHDGGVHDEVGQRDVVDARYQVLGYQVGKFAAGVADHLRGADHGGLQSGGARGHDGGLGVGE